ncbi:PEP/pyruvate-binding domain-containing protein [Pseudobutyrivibrio xylanivorans]|uniref:Pyruvate phosphate dikinase, PEP/pyruvate binding domain n=1 Tax=Pseudobutyrivibrio xylanivorans DSM 14809 TaxID=1123012 RepID=A0A1M6JKD5_PSEXY|nr:PEP/pyruvate-binding domain-containing protein [Pseudobutyrivibrio xylanivorans]SHJ47181.1 Pyruvate phosphate dikinase, PEP/pyruvate binding domain [Pseudobutyrivibrio xylanivorans DSM 14809]
MAAFDRVCSGIPQMDEQFDNIRLGDNVVWRVDSLKDFKLFAGPYVQQAIEDGKNLIYIRFASHEPLFEPQEGLKIVNVELSHRFETFTVDIHEIIEKEGVDAFYVFDCLSELQTAWATDLMMGNFFQVTCPYLFQLDTVAFFPLIRGKHSFKAIAKIRDTTQLFLDVYSDKNNVFVRPDKVWNRYSETMFLPHVYEPEAGTFAPMLDGVRASHFYQLLEKEANSADRDNKDSWDRFFDMTATMNENGIDVTEQCSRMCNIMMTRDERMRVMIKENFKPEDYLHVKSRMIGTGMIGGKACGMLLARKIIENNRPDILEKFEPHDSFYVGSDVFYTFIVENHFWDIRVRQRKPEEYFSLADEFAQRLLDGKFSRDMEEELVKLLEYYGQDPIIVRSSSILEDGFGNAFAGKYESVFCPNAGDMDQRLNELEDAIRTVYASTMSKSALDYRNRRGLQARDEQMALLIQRVSGSYYGEYYMPCAAGVGYSYSPYRFMESLDPEAGMLRLVMGLGTSAVDRTEGSYPRLVSLDNPKATTARDCGEKHKYSQKKLELINRSEGKLQQVELDVIKPFMPYYLQRLLLEHDFDVERLFREQGHNRDIQFISCQGIVEKQEIMAQMKDILGTIQKEYDYPVDTEFTINFSEDGDYVINILQCRPLQVFEDSGDFEMPDEIGAEKVLFECEKSAMGLSRSEKLDMIVYVDPVNYYNMDYKDKYTIANAIGTINWKMRDSGKKLLLMVPGRIGTTSPELGVPTSFADISEFEAICEIANSEAGYNPELSYGSHFFQDLVESGILYNAIFENDKTKIFNMELLKDCKNILEEFDSKYDSLKEIIRIYDVSNMGFMLCNDMKKERIICFKN